MCDTAGIFKSGNSRSFLQHNVSSVFMLLTQQPHLYQDMPHDEVLQEIPDNIANLPNPGKQVVTNSHTSRFLTKN